MNRVTNTTLTAVPVLHVFHVKKKWRIKKQRQNFRVLLWTHTFFPFRAKKKLLFRLLLLLLFSTCSSSVRCMRAHNCVYLIHLFFVCSLPRDYLLLNPREKRYISLCKSTHVTIDCKFFWNKVEKKKPLEKTTKKHKAQKKTIYLNWPVCNVESTRN